MCRSQSTIPCGTSLGQIFVAPTKILIISWVLNNWLKPCGLYTEQNVFSHSVVILCMLVLRAAVYLNFASAKMILH